MIEVVVVDLGVVAARFRPEWRLNALSAASGVTREVLRQRLFDSGLEARSELGDLLPEEVMAAVQAALDGRMEVDEVVEAWALAFEVDPNVLACVDGVDVRTALFTNNGPMLDACLSGPLSVLKQSFDDIVCSWHLKARKPDFAAFERAAEHLVCPPDRLLLLDDSDANVEAAVGCGWQAERVTDAAEMRTAIARIARR